MFSNSIAIGPEFFSKAVNDYANRYWAFAREITQNGLDAPGTTTIDITVEYLPGCDQTWVSVANDGEPMTREILEGKLLSLGGSGKAGDADAVGGFGKAKEVLYFAHKGGYSIQTGHLCVIGRGAGYDLTETPFVLNGTRSDVLWEGDVAERLIEQFRKLVGMTQRRVAFTLNGEPLDAGLRKGNKCREFDWGTVYANPAISYNLVVRVKGVPMFTRPTQSKKGVVVELAGSSVERLTSNRDGLRYPACYQLDDFVTSLAVDTRSALRTQEPEYLHIEGNKFRHDRPVAEAVAEQVLEALDRARSAALTVSASPRIGRGTATFDATVATATPRCKLGNFIVKNTTGRKVPARFRPESPTFAAGAARLARWWATSLVALHQIADHEASFSIGFIFSTDCAAEFEHGRFGKVYYINPCDPSDGKFRLRYTAKDRHRIIASAAHEFTHGLDFDYHNEEYSTKLTEVMGLVIQNMRRFNRCFK